MKQTVSMLSFLACIAGTGNLPAEILFSDNFTYPDGNLVGAANSPWSAHSGAGNGPVPVQLGTIEISRSRNEDVSIALPAGPYSPGGAVAALYAGFTVRFTALPSTNGSYFSHLNTTGARCLLWAAGTNAALGGFRLGVGNRTTDANATSGQLAIDLSLNTDYLVVVRYELATGLTTLWLNPANESAPGVTASDSVGTSLPSISAFAFRQNTGIGIMLIDNLLIGTSFADVTGGNLPPTISALAPQSIPANSNTGPLPFAVGDDQTPAAQLTPTGTSDSQTLVPDGNIVFGGSGGNRTVTVTPAAGQQGQATIMISVSDGTATAQTSFLLQVGAPGITAIANQLTPISTVFGPLNLSVTDAEEGAGALTLSATSSNTALVPSGNIFFGGSGGTRTLTATPASGQTGITTITVTVSDGGQSAAAAFALTVHPLLGLLASDDFNRPDDFLVDWVKWIGHSGPPDELFITNQRLPLSQALSGDASLPLIAEGAVYPEEGGHVFFASFKANFSALPAGAGTYFAHFKDTTNTFRARVIATTTGATAGRLRLGIASTSSTAAPESLHPAELELGSDSLVVVRLNAATGESRLWVNPIAESAGYVDATDFHFPTAVESFAFRQSGPSPGMGVLTVDNLKIGTAFTDVVTDLPVPLAHSINGNTLRLSWPAGQGYLLRRTTALPAAPANWSNVPFVNEGANDVSNLDISTGSGFFRLERSN